MGAGGAVSVSELLILWLLFWTLVTDDAVQIPHRWGHACQMLALVSSASVTPVIWGHTVLTWGSASPLENAEAVGIDINLSLP